MNKHLKALIIALCSIALVIGSVAVTMAYLVDTTDTKTDTFTVGNIDIVLNQTGDISHKMMPGATFDPTSVTVSKKSEACYLFIEIEKSANFGTYLTYTMPNEWAKLNDDSNVYYREVASSDVDQTFVVITDFMARAECTKDQYDDITDETKPYIKLKAYAVQRANIDTAAEAWNVAKP